MERHQIINNYIASFQRTMHDVESLEEFFHRSLMTVNEYNSQVEEECKIGRKIDELFQKVLDVEDIDERNKQIDIISEYKITDSLYLKDICIVDHFTEESKSLQFSMRSDLFRDPKYSPIESHKKHGNVIKYRKILMESVISHIIVVFEHFLTETFKTLIARDPLKYLGEQTVQIADIIKNGGEAIANKIDGVVDGQMRNSLELLKTIEERESINIDRYEKIIKEFSEIYYRRNAFIHTDGCVNKDYLKNVNKEYTKDLTIGQPLICKKTYLENAIAILIKIVFSITFELLQNEDASSEPITVLSEYFFNRLCDKQYEISRYVYLALSQYKNISFEERCMYRINYINACKQLGDEKTLNKELKHLDVSAMQARFVIAKHCLENHSDEIYSLLSKTYPESFSAICIRDWPIFINFRETEQYNTFVIEHADDFVTEEIPIKSEPEKYTDNTIMEVTTKAELEDDKRDMIPKGKWVVEEVSKK